MRESNSARFFIEVILSFYLEVVSAGAVAISDEVQVYVSRITLISFTC